MKLLCWCSKVILFSTVLCEIVTPIWQQYYPASHSWATISEIQNRFRRVRMGKGRYTMLPSGNAEITCEFPNTMLLISNIIWERADMGTRDLNSLYRRHGITHQYDVHIGTHGSTLHLFDVTPLDRGLYRCLASALDPATNQLVTLFQDTEFNPEFNTPYVQLSQGAALNFLYIKPYHEYFVSLTALFLDIVCFLVFVLTFVQAYRYFTRKSEDKAERKLSITEKRSFIYSSFLPFFHVSWIIYAFTLVSKLTYIFITPEAYKTLNPEVLQVCLACASFVFLLLVEAHNWHKKTSNSFSYVFDLGKKTGIEIFDSMDMLEILIKKDYVSTRMEYCIFTLATLNFIIPTLSLLELRKSEFGEKVSHRSFRYKIMHSAALLFLIDIPFFIVRFHSWLAFKDLSMFMMKNLFNIIVAVRGLYLDFITYIKPAQGNQQSKTEEILLSQTEQTQTDGTKTNDM